MQMFAFFLNSNRSKNACIISRHFRTHKYIQRAGCIAATSNLLDRFASDQISLSPHLDSDYLQADCCQIFHHHQTELELVVL
mmetsp:Transcript_7909/g.11960  ORF Transcript_7909/g.11960 Transcript_7909/m.11960 type:complete len:82 (-) Transcript_7909:644-889(-)